MAKKSGVWGIDIGQCAIKALRCTLDSDGESIVADSFDFVEYPKILSQPEADPVELVREALQQFLSRNDLKGDKVAISVSGQSGLSRFFKPPPVDAKMIPNIVKYEARQQIPFPLEEVIWDYQQIGGTEVDGFTLDAEIGLFAMKREQVFRAIQPFISAEIELHIIQLSPLCIFNYVAYELLADAPTPEEVDPDNPPESLIVLSMGTETTDLVITDGTHIWQRSMPLGGNHFTKQLTKEMKLTFAKAEQLKRNAREAEDPKALFQAMRPVFNDLVTEIQRSIGYFRSIDRQAKIDRMVILGNAVKLPGLKQYLSKSLGHEIIEVESYSRLSGNSITAAPAFKDNLLSFSVCYGLCLQGLGKANISTNLLPPEFATARLIREKKPWAVATVGVLMMALAIHYFFSYAAWWDVHPERKTGNVSWSVAAKDVESIAGISQKHMGKDAELTKRREHLVSLGQEVVGTQYRKVSWMKLLTALTSTLPRDAKIDPEKKNEKKEPFLDRREMRILRVESQFFPDLATWFSGTVKRRYIENQLRQKESESKDEGDKQGVEKSAPAATASKQKDVSGPSGPGWVIEFVGYHYHNSSPNIKDGWGAAYVRNTLLKNLQYGSVKLPIKPGSPSKTFTMQELGIGFPLLATESKIIKDNTISNPDYSSNATTKDIKEDNENLKEFAAPIQYFTVQFCWQESKMAEILRAYLEKKKPASAKEGDVAVREKGE